MDECIRQNIGVDIWILIIKFSNLKIFLGQDNVNFSSEDTLIEIRYVCAEHWHVHIIGNPVMFLEETGNSTPKYRCEMAIMLWNRGLLLDYSIVNGF